MLLLLVHGGYITDLAQYMYLKCSVRLFVEVYDHEVFLVFLLNYTIVQLILVPYICYGIENGT